MPRASRAPADAAPWSLRLDWDDLRHALVIAQTGSLKAAAEWLGVQHSTVLRRLNALEQRLGARLFERQRSGCVATEAGELLLAEARRLQPALEEAARRIQGRDLALSGTVRLNTGHVLMLFLLPPILASFAQAHPGITVEVAADSALVDLSRRDADLVLRTSAQAPEHLVGRQLGWTHFAVYALRGHVHLPQTVQPLDALIRDAPWVGFERGRETHFYERWMNQACREARVVMRVDLLQSLHAMLRTGLGIGLLPCYVGARDANLVAVSAPIEALRTPLWLLTHPDLRRTARIRVFMQHLGEALSGALSETWTLA